MSTGSFTSDVRTRALDWLSRTRCADFTGATFRIEVDARELVTTVLEQYGAMATAVSSVVEALEALKCWRPHVLVADIGMPGNDGYALIRAVRAHEEGRLRDTPAIALTAYASVEDRRRAVAAGYQLQAAKPIESAQLAAAVAGLEGRGSPSRDKNQRSPAGSTN